MVMDIGPGSWAQSPFSALPPDVVLPPNYSEYQYWGPDEWTNYFRSIGDDPETAQRRTNQLFGVDLPGEYATGGGGGGGGGDDLSRLYYDHTVAMDTAANARAEAANARAEAELLIAQGQAQLAQARFDYAQQQDALASEWQQKAFDLEAEIRRGGLAVDWANVGARLGETQAGLQAAQLGYQADLASIQQRADAANLDFQVGMAGAGNDAERNAITAEYNQQMAEINREANAIRRELGLAEIDLGKQRMDLDRELGLGQLELGREELALQRELGERGLGLEEQKFLLEAAGIPGARNMLAMFFLQRGEIPPWLQTEGGAPAGGPGAPPTAPPAGPPTAPPAGPPAGPAPPPPTGGAPPTRPARPGAPGPAGPPPTPPSGGERPRLGPGDVGALRREITPTGRNAGLTPTGLTPEQQAKIAPFMRGGMFNEAAVMDIMRQGVEPFNPGAGVRPLVQPQPWSDSSPDYTSAQNIAPPGYENAPQYVLQRSPYVQSYNAAMNIPMEAPGLTPTMRAEAANVTQTTRGLQFGGFVPPGGQAMVGKEMVRARDTGGFEVQPPTFGQAPSPYQKPTGGPGRMDLGVPTMRGNPLYERGQQYRRGGGGRIIGNLGDDIREFNPPPPSALVPKLSWPGQQAGGAGRIVMSLGNDLREFNPEIGGTAGVPYPEHGQMGGPQPYNINPITGTVATTQGIPSVYGQNLGGQPGAIQRLGGAGFPIPPFLRTVGTGGLLGVPEVGRVVAQRGGGMLPSMQGLRRMGPGERSFYEGYLEGPLQVPFRSVQDYLRRQNQGLRQATAARGV